MKAGDRGVRTNGSPPEGVVGGIAEFTNDVATLAELQLKLTLIDLRECVTKALWPIVLTVVGLVLAVASLPVILVGVALLLAALLQIGYGWAMLLTGGGVLVVSGLAAFFFARRIGPSFEGLRRSREELVRNISWIRTVLVHSGRTYGGRQY